MYFLVISAIIFFLIYTFSSNGKWSEFPSGIVIILLLPVVGYFIDRYHKKKQNKEEAH